MSLEHTFPMAVGAVRTHARPSPTMLADEATRWTGAPALRNPDHLGRQALAARSTPATATCPQHPERSRARFPPGHRRSRCPAEVSLEGTHLRGHLVPQADSPELPGRRVPGLRPAGRRRGGAVLQTAETAAAYTGDAGRPVLEARGTWQSRTLIRLSSHPCMRTHLLGDVAAPAGSNGVAAGPGDAASRGPRPRS